ncbi:MAG: lipocalin family protein [Desulfobacterales bacterium]|jgi:apolipoprotein D and lipocalin family protein
MRTRKKYNIKLTDKFDGAQPNGNSVDDSRQKRHFHAERVYFLTIALACMLLTGCQTIKPIYTVEAVDLKRFMGDWYVIASIPTYIEKEAYNAVESYRLDDDGTVATTFRFNKGGFEGPLKTYTPRGFVQDTTSNAVWGMQFIWPFKAEYRIIYLTDDYAQTVIGRSKRDYVWIMAREPSIPNEDYDRILQFLTEQGYKLDKLRKIPHRQLGKATDE